MRRKFRRDEAVATMIDTWCFAKCWMSFCTPGRSCTVGHRASNFASDSARYWSTVISMPGKQDNRNVVDSSRTAAFFQLKSTKNIGERTLAHEPSLDVPCHCLAIATEDIIFERSVHIRQEDKDIECTRNFGIHPLRVDQKACRRHVLA